MCNRTRCNRHTGSNTVAITVTIKGQELRPFTASVFLVLGATVFNEVVRTDGDYSRIRIAGLYSLKPDGTVDGTATMIQDEGWRTREGKAYTIAQGKVTQVTTGCACRQLCCCA